MFLIDDIVLSPAYFTAWIGKQLKTAAESELTDEGAVHQELLALQMRYEEGEIGDEEYDQQEDALMRRLDEIQRMKEQIEEEK